MAEDGFLEFYAGTAIVMADKAAMKAVSVLSDYVGLDTFYRWVADGRYGEIARTMMECDGYSGTQVMVDLADELESAFDISVIKGGITYSVKQDSDGESLRYDGDKPLANATKKAIAASIIESSSYVAGNPPMQNLYGKFAAMATGRALHDIVPKKERHDVAAGQTIIRERVVEREKEPVLEGMLREAMMRAIVDMDTDEIYQQVRSKVISEFGFEPVRHVVKTVDRVCEVDGILHHDFDTVLHWVANDVPVFLVSGAGAGKNVLCKQVAQALGLDYHFMNSVTDEFKISGFIDAYGNYHETEFYKAFKNGGLFFLDEMDASAPEVLVCLNAAISNRYFSFPNGYVEAHPDFRVVAAGNSMGTGAGDEIYTGRMRLDAASLNRFVVVKMDYDRNIDLHCAGGDEKLVDFFVAFRKAVNDIGLPIVASYRNIKQMSIAMDVMPIETAFQQCLCKEMNQDDINMVGNRIGSMGGNKYAVAFSNVESLVG